MKPRRIHAIPHIFMFPTCSCKHPHNLSPIPAVGVQCSLHQQFMARPALTELATAALHGTGADPPLVPAPSEVFLAYCAGDARKSYSSAKPSYIIYFAFHHQLVVRSLEGTFSSFNVNIPSYIRVRSHQLA